MYPLDFEEHLWAQGKAPLAEIIKQSFMERIPLDDALDKEAKFLFKEYMIVGGMPQSVLAYLSSGHSFDKADQAKKLILSLCRGDIKKADSHYRLKVGRLFEGTPGLLFRHDKTVVLSKVDENRAFDAYADAIYWLGDSMTVNNCCRCSDPNIALALSQVDSSVKCYMGDTGLLMTMVFAPGGSEEEIYKKLLRDRLTANQGMFFENVIAQTFACADKELYFYAHRSEKTHKNDAEVDFLVADGALSSNKVIPIEVKSSKNYSTISYARFAECFPGRVATVSLFIRNN